MMGDIIELMKLNFKQLTSCTKIDNDFVKHLYSNKLLDDVQYKTLATESTGDDEKAEKFYLYIASKWNKSQFEEFLKILGQTGNKAAQEILMVNYEFAFLKIHLSTWSEKKNWTYEGISLKDELVARTFQSFLIVGKLFEGDENPNDNKSFGLEGKIKAEVLPYVNKIIGTVRENRIWINPYKQQLPRHYINRTVRNFEGSIMSFVDAVMCEEEKLVLLTDGPGKGKSTALTKLEIDLRNAVDSPRIIIRGNLNQPSVNLEQISDENILNWFIKSFAWFIPSGAIVCSEKIPVYLLLDGLDEMLLMQKEATINMLKKLLLQSLSDDGESSLFVEKIVLTTSRSNLEELNEGQFSEKFGLYTLVPISREEQISFLVSEVSTNEEFIEKKWAMLPASTLDLMSYPSMLYIYSQFLQSPSKVPSNLFSLYYFIVEKRHELYICEKWEGDPDDKVTTQRNEELLQNTIPYYNYLAVDELLVSSEDKDKILSVVARTVSLTQKVRAAIPVIKKPNENALSELISYGLVVMDEDENRLKFIHKSFAEFYYARMMTDVENTPGEVRNALFANIDAKQKDNQLLAKFISCVMDQEENTLQFISEGWTQFVPKQAKLSRYIDLPLETKLNYHILANTFTDYGKVCQGKNQLLVLDTYEDKLFIRWLNSKQKQGDKNSDFVRSVLLHENMSHILAALVFSGDKEIQEFVEKLLSDGGTNDYERIKQIVKKCPKIIQIAVKWEYNRRSDQMSTDSLLERMRRWLSVEDIKSTTMKCLGSDGDFDKAILQDFNLARFFTTVLSKDELLSLVADDETRVSDIGGVMCDSVRRCWGDEFCPRNLIKFRKKFSVLKGKTCFYNNVIRHDLEDAGRVWNEVRVSVKEAVQCIIDDGSFDLITKLEDSIRLLKIQTTICSTSAANPPDKHLQSVLVKRVNLFREILDSVYRSQFPLSSSATSYMICDAVAYGRLESEAMWRDYVKEWTTGKSRDYLPDDAIKCLLLSALNDCGGAENSDGMIRAPFKFVMDFINQSDWEHLRPFIDIITELSREELVALARLRSEEATFLHDLPSVWELFFLPETGLALKQVNKLLLNERMTQKGWITVIQRILFSKTNFNLCCSVGKVLRNVGGFMSAETFKSILLMVQPMLLLVCDNVFYFWNVNQDYAKCYLKGILKVYSEVIHGDFHRIRYMIRNIPVQIMVVAEENGWKELVNKVEDEISQFFNNGSTLTLKNICTSSSGLRYVRECDWYKLMRLLPELKEKIPKDSPKYEKVFGNWECCLLRAWINVFGEEQTRKEANGEFSEKVKLNFSFWNSTAKNMKDGELLHIAVELGSLAGVKATAWPGLLEWRNEQNNKTALELSEEKWGTDHEITRFLRVEYNRLAASGFLKDVGEIPSSETTEQSSSSQLNQSSFEWLSSELVSIKHEGSFSRNLLQIFTTDDPTVERNIKLVRSIWEQQDTPCESAASRVEKFLVSLFKHDEKIIKFVLSSYELSWLIRETVCMSDIKSHFEDDPTRLTCGISKLTKEIVRCLGVECLPTSLLRSKYKFGNKARENNTLFEFCDVTDEILIKRLWNEIIECDRIGSLVKLLEDDDGLNFFPLLGSSLARMVAGCASKSADRRVETIETYGSYLAKFAELLESCEKASLWNKKLILYRKQRKSLNWEDLLMMISFSGKVNWEAIQFLLKNEIKLQIDFENALKCIFMSLVTPKWRKKEFGNSTGYEYDCYRLVRLMVELAKVDEEWKPLVNLVKEVKDEVLLELVSCLTKEIIVDGKTCCGILLQGVPAWELVVGIVQEAVKTGGFFWDKNTLIKLLRGIVESTKCCSFGRTLKELYETVNDDEMIRKALLDWRVLTSIEWGMKRNMKTGSRFSEEEVSCALKGLLEFYGEVFGSLDWLTECKSVSLLKSISVELLEATTKRGEMEELVRKEFGTFSLEKMIQEEIKTGRRLDYNKKRDWETLLRVVNFDGIRFKNQDEKLGQDDTQSYTDRWAPLLRVIVKHLGIENTRELADKKIYGTCGKMDLWTYAREEMVDGELLHVAVQVNSIVGVKATVWPGFVQYRNSMDKTAKEYSTLIGRTRNNITKFLEERELALQ